MEGLPFLPGNTFRDPTQTRFHVSHSLDYKNGYAIRRRPEVTVGGMPLPFNNLSERELEALANFKPTLTYGQVKQAPPEDFIPAQVAWDKKVLRFYAWFKQTVHESPAEHYRVRHVHILYYLEDDSISVLEPWVDNSGMTQGTIIRRQRVPKNDIGDHWCWKEINNGTNITIYGKIFHIYDCDKFTLDWLESQGIEVNPMEDCPVDPYQVDRKNREPKKTMQTPSDFDKLRQFLEMDRKVLRLYCVWDDRDVMFGQLRKFVIHYYLSDDTMEIREVRVINDGYDPFPCLINRHRIPKDRYDIEPSFPLGAMEITDEEVKEYFCPIDFKIGKTLLIYNRRFLIYDMDNFTKAFYWKNFGMTDFTPVDVVVKKCDLPVMEIPPYNMHGSMEDSMQNLRKVVPEPPRKDYIKMLDQQGKILRYEAMLDSTRPGDKCRRFIISYRLSDDTVNIYEPPIRNSGVLGGKFLEPTRVSKPNSPLDKPEYYGPQDFYIGAVIEIFKHRFVITNADYYVLKYLEKHCHQMSACTMQSLRDNFVNYDDSENRQLPVKGGPIKVKRSERLEDLPCLVEEVKTQLKKLAITSNNRKDRIFLGFDFGRCGCINRENLQDICLRHNLPIDNDIIDCLARQIGQDPDRITLEELREFLEDKPQ